MPFGVPMENTLPSTFEKRDKMIRIASLTAEEMLDMRQIVVVKKPS